MIHKLFRKEQSSHLIDLTTGLRTILTARTKEAINKAASKGYMPLVKLVVPNPSIKSKFAVLQNPITGEIELIHDFRAESSNKGLITVIDFTDYNPHHNQSPYAAYLVPKNLKAGEDVWLDDLIENIVGAQWNQGDCFRLPSCKATWDGNDFILQVPKDGPAIMVG